MSTTALPAPVTVSRADWRDWTLLTLHVAAFALVGGWLLTNDGLTGLPLTALAVGLAALAALLLCVVVPQLRRALPWVLVIADWLLLAAFGVATGGTGTLGLAAMLLVLPTLLYLGAGVGLVYLVGAGAALVLALGYAQGQGLLAAALPDTLLGLGVPLAAALTVWVWRWRQQSQESAQQQRRALDVRQFDDLRERTRAISLMANTLSATLKYQRVLDQALNVGRLALRDPESKGFVGAVLLFRPRDRRLHVVNSRGMNRGDEAQAIAGRDGLVGRALIECVPVFGTRPGQDPELKTFVSMARMASMLCIPLRAGFDNYGVLLFASKDADAFVTEYSDLLDAIGTQTTIALQNAVLYQSLAEEKERIVEVEEEARKKLARDLHDGPTQAVSAIAMRMTIAQKLLDRDPSQLAAELRKVEDIARQTAKEIRHMLFTLRPLVLDSQGLAAALEQLAEKMEGVYDQRVQTSVSPEAERVLSSHQQGLIFYIVEEAVNNARKHAKAPVISVRVLRQEDVVLVEIADNGVGFDANAVKDGYDKRGSLGMVNMQERAEMLDAVLTIESAPGRGTTISFIVSVDEYGSGDSGPNTPRPVKKTTRDRFSLAPIR